MKNKTIVRIAQQFGFIALISVIGFSFAACGDGSDPSGGKQGVAPTITTASLPDGTVGTAYSQTFAATGDTPITWSIESGSLPTGLSLAGTTGAITGTPTAAGTSSFTVKATNAAGNDIKEFPITIASVGGGSETAPKITTAVLPGGTVGTAYSQTLAATGDTPVTWTIDSGSLPAGLSLAGITGVISGTPTAAGKSTFTVKATNAAGNGKKQLSITIATADGNQEPEIEGMVWIQGGTFTMGSPTNESYHDPDETQHQVMLTGFYMGKYPVTQAQYQAVMGTNPSGFTVPFFPETSTANQPVENVSWYDAIVFCNKLSISEDLTPAYRISESTDPENWGTVPTSSNATWNAVEVVTGSAGYRLPTEAQWEYACRAGTTTAYNTGDTISDNTGWYSTNSGYRTHTVGEKPANAWGLYDMHGNVWEWCWDWYGTYAIGAQTDPTGPASGRSRVQRGGSWGSIGQYLRSAFRSSYDTSDRQDYFGFRIVRPSE
jgi:formylglycine-generating enzyme required for sulfatase activity